jgi:poly-gamma-glutamate synthase PgsB/CapB
MTPVFLTEDEILALLPPFERATGRRAARAITEAMSRGLTPRGVGQEALARLAAARRRLAETVEAVERESLLREIARREMQARAALEVAYRLALLVGVPDETLIGLAIQMVGDASWRVVRAGFEVLRAEAEAGRSLPDSARDQALALAGDRRAPVWSQVAAWRFLTAVAGGEGAELAALSRELAAALASVAAALKPAADVFVRAEVARLLGRGHPEIAVPALQRAAADPSEHVRMACAAALGALGADRALLRFTTAVSEPSPRVRATAAIALARLDPERLGMILLTDPSETPRRAALEEAEPLAVENEGLRAVIDELAVSAPWPRLRALAADAAERLHHASDSQAADMLARLHTNAAAVPVGGTRELAIDARMDDVGRALAVLTADDHGLSVEHRGGDRWRLTRGQPERRQLWRILHELAHPSPDKRQSHRHTVGHVARGEVRAPTGVLAEVSPTRVPGERVFLPEIAGWGRHLPAVDDLLERPAGGEIGIFSSLGVTRLGFPPAPRWPRTRAHVMLSYARLARLRAQSLQARDAQQRGVYSRALSALGYRLQFHPHRAPADGEIVELFCRTGSEADAVPTAGLAAMVPVAGGLGRLSEWLSVDFSGLHTANQVAAVGAVALGLMAARLYDARREIDRARAAIPLSIGGWGTRGKSGTERLKAALFQSLGCEVFAKTTGCEAMFLHAIPGLRAEEIFIYRTYDKATIWEQRDTLRLAARLGVDVFLWECMALNPVYVDILQRRWMRDDLATLTNTYPDHENVQGPTGMDVARAMTAFIPPGRTIVTAEEQMLPILRDAAIKRGATLINVGWRDVELLPEDLLARFPYQEHPRNIALVLGLAAQLGVERVVALKEMADWIVPDLGVLKTYPEASCQGRRLEFSNGMSANERTGFVGNWSRLGFDLNSPDVAGEWVVTVVNNRGDRNARSAVFADIVASDAAAHRHIVIGTNVRGFAKLAEKALRSRLADIVLIDPMEVSLDPAEREGRAFARAGRVWAHLKLGELGPARLAREACDMAERLGASAELVDEKMFSLVLDASDAPAKLVALRGHLASVLGPRLRSFSTALGCHGAAAVAHLVDLSARHAAVLRWRAQARAVLGGADDASPSSITRLHGSFRDLAVDLFRASLLLIEEPATTGDQVIDAVARAVPPGFRARIMGAQNIKGTGLDFAYRWVGFERTVATIAALHGAVGARKMALALELLARDDLGILDCTAAAPALAAAAAGDTTERAPAWRDVLGRLGARREACEAAITRKEAKRSPLRAIERVLDVWDGVLRKHRAGRVVAELCAGRLSNAATARAMRDLVARQKGGWLGARKRPS